MDIQQQFNADSHLVSRNKNGNIDTVIAGEKVILETSVGNLIPRYTMDIEGRKKEAPIKFYKSGELKSLPLEEITDISTSIGMIKSELLIFYKSGALKRTFPLDGKVSGFWTEEDEYKMADTVDIPTSIKSIKVKPIYLQFYESGELESILFWPGEKVNINTSIGEVLIHKGICFHPNGNIKGFEPIQEIAVASPIGSINVYDPDPNGIYAESHSLNFREDGSIESITTSSNQITIIKDGVAIKRFAPKIITSYCNEDAFFISPLKIIFESNSICFGNINETTECFANSFEFSVSCFVPDKPISKVGCS